MKRGRGVPSAATGKRTRGKGKTSGAPVVAYTTEAPLYQTVQTNLGPMTLQYKFLHNGKIYQVASQSWKHLPEDERPPGAFWALYTIADNGTAVPLSELIQVSKPPEAKDVKREDSILRVEVNEEASV